VFSPRNFIIAGVVLIAIALGPSGHGLWWLVGFLWLLPHRAGRGHLCGGASRRRDETVSTAGSPRMPDEVASPIPDAHHDRHVAFPEAR
jgi:hypothetical protein